MYRYRRIVVLEAYIQDETTACEELDDTLDTISSSLMPGVRLRVASRAELEQFAEAGALLPNPQVLPSVAAVSGRAGS